jgi:hypothetical protein
MHEDHGAAAAKESVEADEVRLTEMARTGNVEGCIAMMGAAAMESVEAILLRPTEMARTGETSRRILLMPHEF